MSTIFYLAKAGCQWSMLPTDLAKRSTTNDYLMAWSADGTWQAILDALRQQVRVVAVRDPNPSKAAIDSQTVTGTEAGGVRGFDTFQRAKRDRVHAAACGRLRPCAVAGVVPGSAPFSLTWHTDTALARRMDEPRDFSAMPLLADALQDNGCGPADNHDDFRKPIPQVAAAGW